MNHNIEIPSQPSRRHSRNDEQAAHPAQGTTASSPRPLEASEYFILNHSQTNSPHQEEAMPPTAQPAHSSPPPSESRDVKKCWVCQQDETDDTPDNSVWRSPCPCSLRAHERCLFEWIADTEAPRPGDVASSKTEIVCPQCKTPYRITRPKDVIVMVTSEIERAAKFMILPTAASAVFGTVYSGLLVYGINSLQLIFGYEEAARIMTPGEFSTITDTPYPVLRKITTLTSQVLWQIKVYMDPFFPMVEATANLKAFFGLPLIAPTLLLSRVGLADELSLTVPVIYLVAFNSRIRSPLWPPRAGMTFAFIPFLRLAYKILYQRVFAELENKWDKAVQRPPREGETAEDIALAQANNDNNDEVFIDIEVQVHEHTSSDEESQAGDDERLAQNEPLEGRRAEVVARVDGDEHREHIHVDNELAAILNDAQAPENQNRHRRHQHLGAISTFQIASTTMGALLFPAVSSIMGDLLKLTLPTRWVSGRAGASGILSQKWGRSVVGGCLFVVLKDVVVLYCKWKNARDFGKRKIVDFVADRK